ncbi:MAG: hypothetical protein HXX11_01620 [Desulfuromonadales bacterium]|nr:hypothetical protein [Desulfuromonadales bacterium]
MNIEFHYWITGLIAQHAGFSADEARIIAGSSQLVDDNDFEINVFDHENDVVPSYTSHVSQTMNILLPRRDIMKIYPLFHFLPGDQPQASPRKDGTTHPLNTTPNSSSANKIMQYSLQSAASKYKAGDRGGLYRIGVTTHAYVDTWAHQNFIGWFGDFNAIGSNLMPDIGHADALHHPDWVSHRWNDERLINPDVDNIVRFLLAARNTYKHFLEFQKLINKSPDDRWDQLETLLTDIFGKSYSGDCEKGGEERVARYRTAANGLADYDDNDWLSSATDLKRVFNGATDDYDQKYVWRNAGTKSQTDWYRFQEAVKEHMICASGILQPAFAQAGISV